MLVISLSLLHKTRDTPSRVNREVSKFFDMNNWHLLRKGEKLLRVKKAGKGFSDERLMKKGSAFFRQRMLRKMYGYKAAGKKKTEKARQKLGCQLLLSKEIILGHPCIPCARLTRVTIRDEV
jgi:hypothetical protein